MKNLFILFFAVFFTSLYSVVPAGVQQLLRSREIRCEGNWSGHLQGFAFDGKDKLYWVFDHHLVQTDLKGKRSMPPCSNGNREPKITVVLPAVPTAKFMFPTAAAASMPN